MRKYKNIQMMCVIVLLGGLLVGCTNANTIANESPDQEIIQESETATLTLMKPPTNSPIIDEAFLKVKTLFEEAHPGVTLKIVTDTPYESYASKISELNEIGKLPDVFQVFPGMAADFAKEGALADLNTFIGLDGLTSESFIESVNELTSIDGELLYLAISTLPIELIYSKKWFDNANVPYPQDGWTWEEAIDIARKLQSAKGDGYGLIIPDFLSFIEPIVMSNGGSFLSPDGSHASGYLDGEATVEAFQWLHDIYHTQKISPVISEGPSYWTALNMIDSQAGMVLSSHDQISRYIVENPGKKDQLGVVGIPKFADGERANSLLLTGYGVSAKSENPELAWELLKFFALDKNEASVELFNLGINSSRILAEEAGEDPYQQVKFNELNYAKKNADQSNKNWGPIVYRNQRYADKIQALLVRPDVDLQSELTSLANEIDSLLAK